VLIDSWHEKRGFRSPSGIHIGYNAVILNGQLDSKHYNPIFDGTIETGRPFDEDDHIDIWERGAHTRAGGMNYKSLGICLIGKSGSFTKKQLSAVDNLCSFVRYGIGTFQLFQHSNFDISKPYCAGLPQEFINNMGEKYK
jgi:hypothetical protein